MSIKKTAARQLRHMLSWGEERDRSLEFLGGGGEEVISGKVKGGNTW